MDARALAQELLATMEQVKVMDTPKQTEELMGTGYFVLRYLGSHSDVNPSEIGQALNVTAARISVIIKRLEKKDLVIRSAHPNDLRKFVINLSETGEQLLQQQEKERLDFAMNMMEYLGEDDAKAYIRIIKKLAQRDNQEKEAN